MTAVVTASEQDLRTLAGIVSEDRPDLPDGEGLPPSLLADLMGQIRCDGISLECFDSGRQTWPLYWNCQPCNYPERTGDLRSIIKISDFYSTRQWHANGMYSDIYRPQGLEHELQLCLSDPAGRTAGPGRTVRLFFFRQSGPDFSERDRAVLTLLRPHIDQAYLNALRRRHPVLRLTPRQRDLLRLVAAGNTNTQIARQLGISEGTVRIHLQNIYAKLRVSSRTAAVTRAFADLAAI